MASSPLLLLRPNYLQVILVVLASVAVTLTARQFEGVHVPGYPKKYPKQEKLPYPGARYGTHTHPQYPWREGTAMYLDYLTNKEGNTPTAAHTYHAPGNYIGYPESNVRYPANTVVGYPNYGYPVVESSPNDVVNQTFVTPWDAAEWDQPLDPNVCRTLGGLTRPQLQVCNRNRDIAGAAAIGLSLAVRECRRQFANHRWNCTALTTPSNNPHTAAIMTRGFSESAFGHAITAAGVTHSVARACAAGRLYNCSCGVVRGKRAWKWSGCHDNTRFGARYSRRFLDAKERARDMITFTHLYNNEVGRKVVRRNREVRCKCHGMSGSCEVRTCWKAAPDFRRVGDMLKEKYEEAKSAAAEVFGNSANTARRYRPVRREISPDSPLLFVERSPTYCDNNSRLEVAGTRGRHCNRTSTGPNSCDTLCCGRGYSQRREVVSRKCNCRFKWCCQVTCMDCLEETWISVCK
ncbi:protein Wnt-4-like [Portunus trituberculatus]|uniref:protein Wnt-4-like n=1 Tax=Portunus trituberculatus TaxID=210409 RepID=UPI001E1D0609|nr:protein Wnt-4-like [Portunus trituberculatus]